MPVTNVQQVLLPHAGSVLTVPRQCPSSELQVSDAVYASPPCLHHDAEPILEKKTLQTRALQLTQKSAAAAPIARGRGDRKGQLCFDLCFYEKCL